MRHAGRDRVAVESALGRGLNLDDVRQFCAETDGLPGDRKVFTARHLIQVELDEGE